MLVLTGTFPFVWWRHFGGDPSENAKQESKEPIATAGHYSHWYSLQHCFDKGLSDLCVAQATSLDERKAEYAGGNSATNSKEKASFVPRFE